MVSEVTTFHSKTFSWGKGAIEPGTTGCFSGLTNEGLTYFFVSCSADDKETKLLKANASQLDFFIDSTGKHHAQRKLGEKYQAATLTRGGGSAEFTIKETLESPAVLYIVSHK